MAYQFELRDDCAIYVDGKFLFAVSNTPFLPDETRNPGESWLSMRERTEPDRMLSHVQAGRLANVVLRALESDSLRMELEAIPKPIYRCPSHDKRDAFCEVCRKFEPNSYSNRSQT